MLIDVVDNEGHASRSPQRQGVGPPSIRRERQGVGHARLNPDKFLSAVRLQRCQSYHFAELIGVDTYGSPNVLDLDC